ncbi:TonB-dependent copper receptor [Paracandidimonas soli]|uniref:Iron complex outermembrane receptor protein n=1 Tax=Paracandidimonas soli TaxID=1917182 RepID=A0A4R3VD00_9BURK|nr:TonB-dependent copper receptor [Paracandidimonas soli]TCV01542.1 iron complex outermembrane receptor protein [Paracandidimonas soli]
MKPELQSSFALLSLITVFPLANAQTVPVFTLSPTVVTAPATEAPLTVITDPKAPRQPLPAHDGADFLKSIPGFSVIRKGGTDGDPVFRGFSGSRLGILLDGQEIYGGCGNRMDPPTAYVYPEQYDRVIVRKGPQSVLYGAGQSAGVVLFERDIRRFDVFGWKGNASATFGSFGRNDQMADVRVGNPDFYVQAGATRADADDYKDGDGRKVHSSYTRWSTNAAIGWTPDDNTRLELSAALSDGEAAYGDRSMDGSKFRRENVSLAFDKQRISPLLEKVEARIYRNYVDHVMDNYSLRDNPGGGMMSFRAMNPDRETVGGRAAVTLRLAEPLQVVTGFDMKHDSHRSRMGMGASAEAADGYRNLERKKNMAFRQFGLFAEATYELSDEQRVIGGVRVDRHEAEDQRKTVGSMMMQRPNSLHGQKDKRTLTSGFARFESDFADGAGTYYAGVGHAQRFPDYWERMNRVDADGKDAILSVKPEKTTQLDIGMTWKRGDWMASLSGFYAHVDDQILLDWRNASAVVARNVDARVMGGELDLGYRFHPKWQATASVAYVYGKNRSDDRPLAQQPPLEVRLGLNYETGPYSAGVLWRVVASQGRYDKGMGGIAGQDVGESAGFGVLSLNAGWKPRKNILLTAGVDNVFDKTYAEHLSRSGAEIGVIPQSTRLYESGRTVWMKMQIAFD